MLFCSVEDVTAEVYSKTVDEIAIRDMIVSKTGEISELTGCTSSNSTLKQACKFGVCAMVCKRMKFTGEMAASVKKGNFQQQNSIDADIQKYEEKEQKFIRLYKNKSYVLPFGRVGYNTVNGE